ncbi:hypothetical protein [Ramlibacter montanisoli]|uniref:STAS domain-containing protein n=1 Tax=Ramlibacter montanisoli TaxID=2732512 RepID=A0A849KEK9_9BURK|nr:hypothetical protein [Ramlibacter montanisoli]NNU43385.1 hypothetical protein [Ramlibacter montanisoli]
MDLDVTVTHEPGRTRVLVSGDPPLAGLSSLLQVLEVDSSSWPNGEVVLDLRKLGSRFDRAEQALLREIAERRLRTKRVELLWPAA